MIKRGRTTPPFPPYPKWTTARFFGFIRSGLREKFNRYPVKYEVLKAAARPEEVIGADGVPYRFKTGQKKGEIKTTLKYNCAKCDQWFKQKEVQVDHKIPAGSLRSFQDISTFVERLFCGPDGLQVLCTTCHDIKTKKEKQSV